jgi:hypothetical protein
VKYLRETNTCIRVLNGSGTATLVERWTAGRVPGLLIEGWEA